MGEVVKVDFDRPKKTVLGKAELIELEVVTMTKSLKENKAKFFGP